MISFKKITLIFFAATVLLACSSNSKSNPGNCATVCEYTLASGETAGTAATSIEGEHNLTMSFADAASPFSDGTKATFTLINNILTVEVDGQECITIKNPILTTSGSTEIQFKDTCRDNLVYAVSMTQNGDLNEINLGDLNGKFLGQFNDR